MIESIEKLRESSHLDDSKWTLETGEVIHVYGSEPNDPNAVNWGERWRKIADEIEREIAERYVMLPCDVDGVPWHIGDAIKGHGELRCMSLDKYGWAFAGSTAIDPRLHCHVNPRTIEDVLRDLVDGIDSVEFDALTAIGEAAEEIRELMEVDR